MRMLPLVVLVSLAVSFSAAHATQENTSNSPKLINRLLSAVDLKSRADAQTTEKRSLRKKSRVVRTTAYTHTEADHLEYGKANAMGTTLQNRTEYTSAAADWSRFPVGTRFRIKGNDTIFIIDDYGSALVGTDTIDIYHPCKPSMNDWGVRHVVIEILEPGCEYTSKDILSGRLAHDHCLEMYLALKD